FSLSRLCKSQRLIASPNLAAMASTKVQRVMTQPINLIFRFLQSGFDEYMNLVLDDAEEVNVKKKSRKTLGFATCALSNDAIVLNREDPS
ncbi:hypothetical protein RYX36_006645, partial [Vicia faba]